MPEHCDPGALPARIDRYRILRLLGEGSAGRVYLALEEHPEREVALKVLRSAALAGQALARFQREVELLARLEHPGIARLYASGTASTDTGPVPYLAMEYVRGSDLCRHAAQAQLELSARLRLMVEVCRAVHHAHTRGVVHRDLKPGNILVDERGAPKVLDFGIAHVADQGQAQMTVAGQVLGTLPYMSPEQLGGGAQADPRIDVYALGAILYELVSGRMAHPVAEGASFTQVLEQVVGHVPQRLGRVAPDARGDLETIVHKALAQDPARRYGSAAELGFDLERLLARQPIQARPPTVGYVAGLFMRRHRVLAAAALLVVGALIAATAVSLRYAAQAQRRLAEREAVNRFLVEMLAAADPGNARGNELTMREALDSARLALNANRELAPPVRAALLDAVGATYAQLGAPDLALPLLDEARALLDAEFEPDEPERLAVELDYLTALYFKSEHARIVELGTQALASLGSGAQRRPEHWRLRLAIAAARLELGEIDAAAAEIAAVLPEVEQRFGPLHDVSLEALQLRAAAARLQGDYPLAAQTAEQVVERRTRTLGADHPETLHSRNGVATHYARLGEYGRAESLLRAVLADRERVLGAQHPDVWRTQQNLAVVLLDQDRTAEGAALLRDVLASWSARYGEQHRETLRLMNNLATAERDLKNLAEGERLLRRVIQIQRGLPASQHEDLYLAEVNLALNLEDQRKFEEALQTYRSALASAARGLPDGHPNRLVIRANYGSCLVKAGRPAEARAELEPTLAGLREKLGPEHPRTRKAAARLRDAYVALGLPQLAAQVPEAPP